MTDSETSRYAFLINPEADSGRALKVFNRLRPVIEKEFPGAGIFIAKDRDIKELCRQVSDNYSRIVSCGGDGTAHLVGSALMNRNNVTMGILPIGSGNDIAYSLGYPPDLLSSLNSLKVFQAGTMDVIKINDITALNTIGIGLDGYINLLANNKLKVFNKLRYLFSGVIALSTFKRTEFKYTTDRSYHRTGWMLCLANGKREGGRYIISPDSVNNDGLMEVLFLKAIGRHKLLKEFFKLSFGGTFDPDILNIQSIEGLEIQNAEKYDIHIDGEYYQLTGKLQVSLIPGALRVLRR